MGGLNAALTAAQRSLGTFSSALSVINDNISNASTPGYARQRVSLAPIVAPGGGQSLGVEIQRIESLRIALLDFQVLAAQQKSARLESLGTFYQTVEPVFRLDAENGLGGAVDQLFGAASAVSVNPSDPNLRSAFINSADEFASTARQTFNELAGRQADLESQTRAAVNRVNELVSEIADLQSRRGTTDPRTPNTAVETRTQQALEELAGLVEFSVLRQQDGTMHIVTGSTPLLTGVTPHRLTVSLAQNGLRVFDGDGRDQTATFEGAGGRLGALLEARNQLLPALMSDVNRLAKNVADRVNEQLAQGVDQTGLPGAALFDYATSHVTGSGRVAGTLGAATPAPPTSVDATFSGGVSGSISAALDGFFVGAAPPTAPAPGDRISVSFTSADGSIARTITAAPLLGGESTADLATRLNDQIALEPDLAGLVSFSDEGGALKLVLSDAAGQGFDFTATTTNPAFTTGLEAGGSLGGRSAEEIAAALNAEVALDPNLTAAGVRFVAVGGELRLDGDVAFDFAVVDNDPAGTGFVSGLPATGSAGGGAAAATLTTSGIGPAGLAVGAPGDPSGNANFLSLAALGEQPLLDGHSFNEFFAGFIGDLGSDAADVASRSATQSQVTLAAENLRDGFSGVDVNEEAVLLLQFEQGFSAMLRVIQTIDRLSNEVLGLIR